MISKVTVGGKERLAILLHENYDASWVEWYHKAIMDALEAISMSKESKDTLSSTSMYFLLQLVKAMEEKGDEK